ncbi:MAG: 30S ribosomal protein S30e [Thermoprotei archaeon]|nr:MAG: 30S ribosomal protein S30e [Thermoprotei archaeon]
MPSHGSLTKAGKVMKASLEAHGFRSIEDLARWRKEHHKKNPTPRIKRRKKYTKLTCKKHL